MRGERVCEVHPPKRQNRAAGGKSDSIDAVAAARTTLCCDIAGLNDSRAEGLRSALRVLLVARRGINARRTADRNALNALIRTHGLGIDARSALSDAQVAAVALWRTRPGEDTATATIRGEAKRLARAITSATEDLAHNHATLQRHVAELMPGILDVPAVGPVTAAILLPAWSHRGRVRSEAAFAALAGVAPLPASSGKTVRHRLNRSGDRQLNIIARVRTSRDPETRNYVARRIADGRTNREIRRCLKRYIARQLYRQMRALSA